MALTLTTSLPELREVTSEAKAPALFPPDEGVVADHLRCHVLEADAGFVHRHVVDRAQFEQHDAGGQCLDYGTALAAHLEEIEGKQGEDLQRGERDALLIHNAQAVGITIGGKPNVRFAGPDCIGKLGEMTGDRLRLYSREGGVSFPVDLRYLS